MSYRVLVVDDDSLSLAAVKGYLEPRGFHVDSAHTATEAYEKARFAKGEYALIILDYQLGSDDGAVVARALREICSRTYILMYSGDSSREAVKSSWEAGAIGFIEKGSEPEKLLATVRSWCRKYEETYLAVSLSSCVGDFTHQISSIGLVGRSKVLAQVVEKVQRYAGKKENVLILGETGTGKERVARALHKGDDKKFFPVNCAAYNGSAELMESDLFGYTRGAFTGANKDHTGVFESAEGGTVFLDEVHTLDLKAQQKLLRALQEKAVRPVGTTREYKVDFRLVAAAKPELLQAVEAGTFLEDLYERINVLPIIIPPLRERIEDVEPLVAYFTEKYEQESGERRRFLVRTVRYLERYSWPRNVRELENLVRRLCIDAQDSEITPEHLDARFFEAEPREINSGPVRSKLEQILKQEINEVLKAGVSQREAARRLGIPDSSFRRMLKKFEIFQGL